MRYTYTYIINESYVVVRIDKNRLEATKIATFVEEIDALNYCTNRNNDIFWIEVDRIRKVVADYMHSEGCGCCSNKEKHAKNEKRLALLLQVEPHTDGSGYNFDKYRSK